MEQPTANGTTAAVPTAPIAEEGMTAEQQSVYNQQMEDWRKELETTENDIATLRSLLQTKMRRSQELKRKLGVSPLQEMKADLNHGLQNVKESTAFQAADEAITNIQSSEVVQKTNAALSSFGELVSRKWYDMKGSETYQHATTKVGSAYTNVKEQAVSTGKVVKSYTFDAGHPSASSTDTTATAHGDTNGVDHS